MITSETWFLKIIWIYIRFMAIRMNEKSSNTERGKAKKEGEREESFYCLFCWCMASPHASVARVYYNRHGVDGLPEDRAPGPASPIGRRGKLGTPHSTRTGRPVSGIYGHLGRFQPMPLLNNVFDLWTILRINYTAVSCRHRDDADSVAKRGYGCCCCRLTDEIINFQMSVGMQRHFTVLFLFNHLV